MCVNLMYMQRCYAYCVRVFSELPKSQQECISTSTFSLWSLKILYPSDMGACIVSNNAKLM